MKCLKKTLMAFMAFAVALSPLSLSAQDNSPLLWSIGTKDGSGSEFALSGKGAYKKFSSAYKDGLVFYQIGKDTPGSMPYIIPGPDDVWSGKNGRVLINFGASVAGLNSDGMQLRINLAEVHPTAPRLRVQLNGFNRVVRVPKGENKDYPDDHRTSSRNLFVEINIPPEALNDGDNTLIISNEAGSWLVLDNIEFYADGAVLTKASGNIVNFNTRPLYALVYGKDGKPEHPVEMTVVNMDRKNKNVSVDVDGVRYSNVTLKPGINTFKVGVPETKTAKTARIEVMQGGKAVTASAVDIKPVKDWNIYLVQHTHTDIGYTKPQTEILTEHLRYIDYVVEYCEQTENYPDDAKFRWTCEASWATKEYLKNRPAEQIAKLKKYVDNGQIEITGMFFNMSEIWDESSVKTFLAPIKEFKELGIPVRTAMQNDVNGAAWCLADHMPDLGVEYLWMGEHGHRALIPFDKPTVFNWESPSGKPMMAFRADHYNTGNFWGVENGDINNPVMCDRIFEHLTSLEDRNYPFNTVAVQYSGYFTDNSPPSTKICDLVKEWNETYASPKLRSALPVDFMDYIKNNYSGQIESYREAYPDWWTDGFGTAARETAASRTTHADMITIEGMLAMARAKGGRIPEHVPGEVRRIHENLLFYDEHTFGSHESIHNPMSENTMVQWAEKSSYVWEGLKSAQMLYETSIGLLQQDLYRGARPTVTFFNTLAWPRTSIQTVYIDYEVIPRDREFKIVDENGKALKVQAAHSRSEGRYYAILAEDVPAMGYKTYEIVVANTDIEPLPATVLEQNIMENEYYRITVNPSVGSITSLIDKTTGQEMADSGSEWDLGQVIFEKPENRRQMELYKFTDYTRVGMSDCRITGGYNGPIYQSLLMESKLPGIEEDYGVKVELRLYHNSKRIELEYSLRRLPEMTPGGIYVAFPFKLDGAKLAYDVQGGVVYPGENQLTGTTTEWYTVQNFVSARNDKSQYIMGTRQLPLYQLGGMMDGPFQYEKTYEKPHVFSWVMNNYWVTNFRASQEGQFGWSYYLTSSDDVSDAEATHFTWDSRVPLYARVMPVGKENGKPKSYSALAITNPNLLMCSCGMSAEKDCVLLNVREISGSAAELEIVDGQGNPLKFEVVNAIDEPMGGGMRTGETFKGYENKFVRVKVR